jgi:hypothetical protein
MIGVRLVILGTWSSFHEGRASIDTRPRVPSAQLRRWASLGIRPAYHSQCSSRKIPNRDCKDGHNYYGYYEGPYMVRHQLSGQAIRNPTGVSIGANAPGLQYRSSRVAWIMADVLLESEHER